MLIHLQTSFILSIKKLDSGSMRYFGINQEDQMEEDLSICSLLQQKKFESSIHKFVDGQWGSYDDLFALLDDFSLEDNE